MKIHPTLVAAIPADEDTDGQTNEEIRGSY